MIRILIAVRSKIDYYINFFASIAKSVFHYCQHFLDMKA